MGLLYKIIEQILINCTFAYHIIVYKIFVKCHCKIFRIITTYCLHHRYYAVIVVIGGGAVHSTNVEDIGPFNKEEANIAISNGQPYTYITSIVETSDISDYPYPYMVGDGSRSSIGGVNYENIQLQTNTIYAIMVRAYTTDVLVSERHCDRDTYTVYIHLYFCFVYM